MFFALLTVTFLLSATVSFIVVRAFKRPIEAIFQRIIKDEVSSVWERYITFAAYVVGISGGVRIHQLERYIDSVQKGHDVLLLNTERWTLEVYRTVIETLQSLAWMYLLVFIFALIAFVLVKGFETRHAKEHKNG